MPGCSAILDDIDPDAIIDAPESVKLWLPSALPTVSRDVWCTSGLLSFEFRLRYAQAVDSLDQLRRLRRLLWGLVLQAKKHPSPTQRTTTRSQSVWDGLGARIAQVCSRYRDARIALLRLHPSGVHVAFFKELKKEDVRGPGREDDDFSESHFIPSWIWTLRAPSTPTDLPGPTPTDCPGPTPPSLATHLPPFVSRPTADDDQVSVQEMEDYIRVDWAKAQERAKRFEEEVELCTEEMRRTLAYFSWNALEWEKRAEARANGDSRPSDNVLQGLRAYALRRSAMFREMVKVFVNDWYCVLEPKGLGAEWLAGYLALIMPQRGRNAIPSIIPPTLEQDQDAACDDMLSDQDKTLGQPEQGQDEALEQLGGDAAEQDADSKLHNDFL